MNMPAFNERDDNKPTFSEGVMEEMKSKGISAGAALASVIGAGVVGWSAHAITAQVLQHLDHLAPVPAGIFAGTATLAAGLEISSRDSRLREAFADFQKAQEDIRNMGKSCPNRIRAMALPVKVAVAVADALNQVTNGKGFLGMMRKTRKIQAEQKPNSNTWLVRYETSRGVGNWVEKSEAEFAKLEARSMKGKSIFIKEWLNSNNDTWDRDVFVNGARSSLGDYGPARTVRPTAYAGGPSETQEKAFAEWYIDNEVVTPAQVAVVASGISEDDFRRVAADTSHDTGVSRCSVSDDLKSKIAGATHVRFEEGRAGLLEVQFGDGPLIRAGFLEAHELRDLKETLEQETDLDITYEGVTFNRGSEAAPSA